MPIHIYVICTYDLCVLFTSFDVPLTEIGDYENPPMISQQDSLRHNIQVMKNQVCQVLSTTSLSSQWTRLREMKLYSSLKPPKFMTQGITYKVLLVGALALSSPPENKYIHKKYSSSQERDITLININITKTNTRLHSHLKFSLHHCKEWWCLHFNKIKLLQYTKPSRVTQTCFPNENRYVLSIAASLLSSNPSHSIEAELTQRY